MTQKKIKHAGFFIRAISFIIDIIVIAFPIGFSMQFFFGGGNPFSEDFIPSDFSFTNDILPIGITMVTTVLFWVKFGKTPGKFITGIKVVDLNYEKISFIRGIIRYLGYMTGFAVLALSMFLIDSSGVISSSNVNDIYAPSGLILFSYLIVLSGFFFVAFRKDKRSLHDLIAGTCVIVDNKIKQDC